MGDPQPAAEMTAARTSAESNGNSLCLRVVAPFSKVPGCFLSLCYTPIPVSRVVGKGRIFYVARSGAAAGCRERRRC